MSAWSPSRARTLLMAVAVASTVSKKRAIRSETEAFRDPVLAARHGGSATCTVPSHEPVPEAGNGGSYHDTTQLVLNGTWQRRRKDSRGVQELKKGSRLTCLLTLLLQSCAAVPSIAVRPAKPCSRDSPAG